MDDFTYDAFYSDPSNEHLGVPESQHGGRRSSAPSPAVERASFIDHVIDQKRRFSTTMHDIPSQASNTTGLADRDDPPDGVVSFGGLASNIQDKMFAKIVGQILPPEAVEHYAAGEDKRKDLDRPAFSLTLMSKNFRRFNTRIGIVFVFQHRLMRIFQWKHPTHTLSVMAVYSFVCLDPYLLAALPLVITLLFIMVPAYYTRHPPPPTNSPTDPYSAKGPASAAPPEIKAVSELSKDFFRNLRDLQNSMHDFSEVHDQVIATVAPPTNFSNEPISSSIFLLLFILSGFLFITARYVPWRPTLLLAGWVFIFLSHPNSHQHIKEIHHRHIKPRSRVLQTKFESFVKSDIILDASPEVREVEIFELQRRDLTGEWEPWMFSPAPYEKLSVSRISGEKPKGTRFFEDVKCPKGWEWKDKKWTLDLSSKIWVEERYIEGVEVEIEAERWVYDILEGDEGWRGGTGEWRRRRWIRNVRRQIFYSLRRPSEIY